MSQHSFRFGTVGTPKNKPKSPGGSVGGIYYLDELGLRAMELGCDVITEKPGKGSSDSEIVGEVLGLFAQADKDNISARFL